MWARSGNSKFAVLICHSERGLSCSTELCAISARHQLSAPRLLDLYAATARNFTRVKSSFRLDEGAGLRRFESCQPYIHETGVSWFLSNAVRRLAVFYEVVKKN